MQSSVCRNSAYHYVKGIYVNKQIAVIGLGRFGQSLCLELMQQGAEVFAIDVDEVLVNEIADQVTQAVVADCSNENTVKELNLSTFDSVFVAIGEDSKASILTTLILKETGVKNIWVKTKDKFHEKIILKVGADHVINPEHEMGKRVSRHLLTNLFFDYLDMGDGIAICEIEISDQQAGQEVQANFFKKKYQVDLLALKRLNVLHAFRDESMSLICGDIIVLGGRHEHIRAVLAKL